MAPPSIGIVVFPGSNCDQDCWDAVTHTMGLNAKYLWYADVEDLSAYGALLLPGGFSYGDYLRCGAIARQAPLMPEIVKFAEQGRPVLGICNGFQVLTEARLLPGALIRNEGLHFVCQRRTALEVASSNTPFTRQFESGQLIELPVAHGEGNFTADEATLKQLELNDQVVFRYADNINGSLNQIAGICNEKRNVVGMMPHPERNLITRPAEGWTGEGALMFKSLLEGVLASA